jgi:hypothetical protein
VTDNEIIADEGNFLQIEYYGVKRLSVVQKGAKEEGFFIRF